MTRLPIAALLLCLFIAAPASAEDWPQWRGPDATGYAPASRPPLEFGPDRNVVWKAAIPGEGHASPIVIGDRVIVMTAVKTDRVGEGRAAPSATPEPRGRRGGRGMRSEAPTNVYEFRVLALDRASGAILWNRLVREEVPHEGTHGTGSFAPGSPVSDGRHIYASFGSRGIYCLDMEGNVVWEKDLGDMSVRNSFGEGASPALLGEMLVIAWDHEGESFIVGLDATTGAEQWRQERDLRTSWSTPVITTVNLRPQVVVAGTGMCMGYDLRTGEEIWRCEGLTNATASPLIRDGLAYFMSGFRGSQLIAVRLDEAKGDITGTDAVAWTLDRNTPYVPTGMLANGLLYFLRSNNGVLTCVDAHTGQENYAGERLDVVRNVYASIVGAGDHLFICGREGNVAVIRMGPAFELVRVIEMGDGINASPAIAGDRMYLRTTSTLYCFGEGGGEF